MNNYALIDKSGKTRATAEARDKRGAAVAFRRIRKGKDIPPGWSIVKRAPKALPVWKQVKEGDIIEG